MHNYDHKKISETIRKLDEPPFDEKDFAEWIKAGAHLAFLRANSLQNEVVVFASGEYTFLHSLVVPNGRLSPIDQEDLLHWSCNPYQSNAGYVSGGGRDGVWVERGLSGTGTRTLEAAVQLVFGRTFEGWSGTGRNYLELNQEYAHVAGIHWRPEQRAYCRFDENGDLEPVVSVTNREDKGSEISLVTFKWEPLEEYLSASNSSLVRMFDFTLVRRQDFPGWSDANEERVDEAGTFFYRMKIDGKHAGYTRGIQIVGPRRTARTVQSSIVGKWTGRANQKYVEFIAHDWRNRRVARISTDPTATTNYFAARGNSLPFEVSPAFFRPEVLSKYKTDRDKYTVSEREVSCRAAWHLRGIDVNEAGQVHAYICDLRKLPYSEQLHWSSYNEEPRAGISERAVTADFKGEFSEATNPLQNLISIVHRWDQKKVPWWALRDEKLVDRVNVPLTSSRDEWAEAFMDLAKLVVEGFETKHIRVKLDQAQISYRQEDKTITLLEILLGNSGNDERLEGLRSVQNLRSKAKGHVGGSGAEELARDALTKHETFANHFKHVCQLVSDDLEAIERVLT